MNIRKYYLITSCNEENPNPGDIFIRKGIENLITMYESSNENIPVFNYVNIFGINEDKYAQMELDAQHIIVCGTPQITNVYIPDHFNKDFYNRLRKI